MKATAEDIPYAQIQGAHTKLTSLDIYAPSGANACPVMVFIHGGGWRGGDKSDVGLKPDVFVMAGYVLVSVNYRLVPAVGIWTQAADAARAIAWVHSNIADCGGNPEAICLMGHSSGAHLAALVGACAQLLETCGKDLSIIKGVVLLDGAAYDIPRLKEHYGDSIPDYNIAFGTDPATWEAMSPARHIAAGRRIPPFLIIHAGQQPVRKAQAENMARLLTSAGVRAEVLAAPDKTHATLSQDFGLPGDKPTEEVMDFLSSLHKPKE